MSIYDPSRKKWIFDTVSKLFLIQICRNYSRFEAMMNMYEIFHSNFMSFYIFLTGSSNQFWNYKVFLSKNVRFVLIWSKWFQLSINHGIKSVSTYIFLFQFLTLLFDRSRNRKTFERKCTNQATLDAKMKTHTKSKSMYISPRVSYLCLFVCLFQG